MDDDQTRTLQEWMDELARATDTADIAMDEDALHTLLDLARDAARNVDRPAAPLTMFLVGVAVGRGQSLGAVAARATQLAVGHDDPSTDPA